MRWWLTVCALLGLLTDVRGSINLWVSKSETRALIGLATEIFYVQEGVINDYAMNFTVIVPHNITDLHFNWERTTRKPVDYNITLEVADPSVLDRPTLNIRASGTVPQGHEVFTVHLPCRPGITAETDVRLKINLMLPRQPPLRRKRTNTLLTFRRTRVCRTEFIPPEPPRERERERERDEDRRGGDNRRGGDAEIREPMLEDAAGPTRLGDPPPPADEDTSSSGVLYMAIGSSCGVVLVIMIILAVVLSRNNAAKRRKRALSDTSGEYDTTHHYMQVPTPSYSCHSIRSSHHYASLRPLPTCPSYTSQKTVTTPLGPAVGQTHSLGSHGGAATFGQQTLSHSVSQGLSHSSGSSGQPTSTHGSGSGSGHGSGHGSGQRVRDVGERVSELMVDRRRVEIETVLEEGNFGRIATGWMADSERGEKERLIIKYASDRASPAQVSLLLQEGLVFYGLRHKNLLSVIGVAVEERAPPLVLYPYVKHWNLKQYLQTCSFGSRSDVRTLTVRDVVDLAEQVTQALLYLHMQNICHTDIAARNCCIDDSLHVKLADNALARDLFPDDYCCLADNINRSIKWMAMEAILTNQFTPAADVWSFGVLLWELTTLAQQPYVEVDPFEMAGFLDEGYRLAQPLNCPDKLFSVMAFCWSREPEERPTAEQILDYLHSFTKQLSHYL